MQTENHSRNSKKLKILIPYTPFLMFVLVLVTSYTISFYLSLDHQNIFLFYCKKDAIEYFWRALWASLLVIITLYSLIIYWTSAKIIYNNLEDVGKYKGYIYSGFTIVVVVVMIILSNLNSMFGPVEDFLVRADGIMKVRMSNAVYFQFGISSIAVLVIIFAACTIIYNKENYISIKVLRKKNRDFKKSFYWTSGYLGIAVIQFYSLFTWASHAIGVEPSHKVLIYSITIGSSILYTLIFAAMFIPVYLRIGYWIESIAKEYIDVNDTERLNNFKKDNGFYDSPRNSINKILILISPIIIGLLSSISDNYFKG